jgi:hypothetical protein
VAAYVEFREIMEGILGRYERSGEDYKRQPPTQMEVRDLITRYTADSQRALDGIAATARRIGISLLTVDEYDEALQTEGSRNPKLIVIGEITMSKDTYNVGQAGAVGPNAHTDSVVFNQPQASVGDAIDARLVDELAKLRAAMKNEADDLTHDIAVSEIAKAEQAARENKPGSVAQYLKAAGQWALDVATKLGTSVAVEAIKQSMGTG